VTYDEVVEAGEHIPGMAALWDVATPEERREMVIILLEPGGLYYDMEQKIIAAIKPLPAFLPILRMLSGIVEYDEAKGLLVTERWQDRNRRVLNRVAVERFVLLVNRMGQAIARVLVRSKWERRKPQASDDPQDDQRDRQSSSTNSSSFMKCSCFVLLRMLKMDVLSSQYNKEEFL
jgi:hypothetical protein